MELTEQKAWAIVGMYSCAWLMWALAFKPWRWFR